MLAVGAGLRRAVRRDLPPDRHDDAGGGGGRQARPVDRRQRRVRQYRRGAGAGGDGVPGQRRSAGAPPSSCRACCASASGLLWLRTPLARASARTAARRPFPPIPRHLVRRAVVVLLLIAMSSGLVFNAFTLLLPKLMQERLADSASLLPLVGLAAFLVTLCGALTQFTRRAG